MYQIYNPYATTFIAVMGALIFGFDISSVSAFVSNESYLTYFNHPDSTTQGGITAAMAGGSFCASLVAGIISDKFGRNPTLKIAAIFWTIGAAIQCSSINIAQLICGRFISGIGVGLASSTVPVFIAEVSPRKIRGRLNACFQWAVTWGIMIMFFISYGLSFINGPTSFRTAWGIQMVPGVLMFSLLYLLPESPRWLAVHGKWEEAIYIVGMVEAKGDMTSPNVIEEIADVKESVEIAHTQKSVSYFELLQKGSRLRTFVGVSTQVWQQLTGMNVMMYYIVYIFNMAGYKGNALLISSAIQYIINVVLTIPALLWIDKWGRRPTLLIGSVLMMVWLFATAGMMASHGHYVDSVNGNANLRWIIDSGSPSKCVIAFSYLFVASFAPTWGPTAWIYTAEIFPLRQRAVATGVCTASNWIFNFALAFFVPPAFTNIQWKVYIIFGVFCLVMTIQVYFLFPETKGLSLEQIETLWEEKIPAWKTSNYKPETRVTDEERKEVTEKALNATHLEKVKHGHIEHAISPNETSSSSAVYSDGKQSSNL